MVSFEEIQTVVRKAFDPETISVVVGRVSEGGVRFRIAIRDELTKIGYTFHISLEHTMLELQAFIKEAAEKLNLTTGPDKIGDEVVEGAHNHD